MSPNRPLRRRRQRACSAIVRRKALHHRLFDPAFAQAPVGRLGKPHHTTPRPQRGIGTQGGAPLPATRGQSVRSHTGQLPARPTTVIAPPRHHLDCLLTRHPKRCQQPHPAPLHLQRRHPARFTHHAHRPRLDDTRGRRHRREGLSRSTILWEPRKHQRHSTGCALVTTRPGTPSRCANKPQCQPHRRDKRSHVQQPEPYTPRSIAHEACMDNPRTRRP